MSLNAATIEYLLGKGLSGEDLLEVARRSEMRSDPTATMRKRRQREREREMSQRDVTRDQVPPNDNILTPSGSVSPDEADASSPSRQPVAEATECWNEISTLAGWPTIRELTPNRSRSLSARLRQHGLEGWQAAVARARSSPYLGGSDPPAWFTFDWLVKSTNFQKLIEGNYDRNRSSNPTGNAPSAWGAARDFVRVQHG